MATRSPLTFPAPSIVKCCAPHASSYAPSNVVTFPGGTADKLRSRRRSELRIKGVTALSEAMTITETNNADVAATLNAHREEVREMRAAEKPFEFGFAFGLEQRMRVELAAALLSDVDGAREALMALAARGAKR